MPVKKPTRVKKVAGGKRMIALTSAFGPKVTTVLVIFAMAGGIMVAARQQQTKAKNAPADVRAEMMSPMPASKPAPAPAKTIVTASAVPSASGTVASATPAPKTARATVTGCLEDDGPVFKLTETTGTDAPKARSWKSGFLKKGAAPVKLVDTSHALNLSSHVGRRVSVTGTLANREMHAQSVHRVAGTCKAN
jgi:hypothetical protein